MFLSFPHCLVKLSHPLLFSFLILAEAGFCEQNDRLAADKEKAKELVNQARAGDTSAIARIGKLSPEVAIPLLQPGGSRLLVSGGQGESKGRAP